MLDRLVEFQAVVVEAVPVVRGVAPLVDLAAPDVEALGLLVLWLGSGDGRDGEEADHFGGGCPCGAALDNLRAGGAYQRVPVSSIG